MELIDYIGIRIREERARLGLTQQEVADFVGVTRQSQAKYEKGTRSPDALYLDKILKLGFNSYYILTGSKTYSVRSNFDDMDDSTENIFNIKETNTYDNLDPDSKTWISDPSLHSEHGSDLDENNHSIDNKITSENYMEAFAHIPLYEVKAAAGNGVEVHTEEVIDSLAFKNEWIHNELHVNPSHLYLIYVEGESMEPSLRPGDVILVDHSDNTARRDGIYVLRMDGALLVKRLQRLPGAKIKVSSDNPIYDTYEVDLAKVGVDISIIGRVVWTGRRI
tara:strand:+ start:65239 stop:66072 length:834 start_codon:yes stop_codon:yes gene_type:complete